MQECTNTKQLLKLIAQEPNEEKEQNKFRLNELGKLFHLYYARQYFEALGVPIREIILIDDLAEQGVNTARFWPKIMPGVTFKFIHAQKGDEIEYIRQVRKAIEPTSIQTAGNDLKSALRAFSTFSPRGNSVNSNDDRVQNTPEKPEQQGRIVNSLG